MSTPNPEKVEPKVINEPKEKKSGSSKFLMGVGLLVFFILLICLCCCGTFYFIGKNTEDKVADTINTIEEDLEIEVDDIIGWQSNTTRKDNTWSEYRNSTLGFEIQIPNQIISYYGGCRYDAIEKSYRPKSDPVKVIVLEDESNGRIYISPEYYYKLSGEEIKDGKSYFSKCDKVPTTLENVLEDNIYYSSWEIVTLQAESEFEINEFIVDRYGIGCNYEGRKESNRKGIFDIVIGGELPEDMTFDDPTKCNINYSTVLKYIPASNILVSWNTGQSCTFLKGSTACYDDDMVNSFKLVNN